MKALIFNNIVMQVTDTPFEVHSDWTWVDCSLDVQQGYTFDGTQFKAPVPIPQRTYSELRAKSYPSIGDQLDALWKGGDALEEMHAKILAVKNKYPKE